MRDALHRRVADLVLRRREVASKDESSARFMMNSEAPRRLRPLFCGALRGVRVDCSLNEKKGRLPDAHDAHVYSGRNGAPPGT
jgi:hypothetical protein